MPDTIRSQAAVLALLPDNTAGDISPQDLRDAIVSLYAETPASMTVSAFDTETTSGTLNPNYRRIVHLSDGLYTCIWNGSAWEYYYGSKKVTRPPSSGWTWVNQGGSSVSYANGAANLTAEKALSNNYRALVRSTPTPPYTLKAGFRILQTPYNGDNSHAGFLWRQSSDGKMVIVAVPASSDSLYISQVADVNSAPSHYRNFSARMFKSAEFWVHVEDNNTNRITYFTDGNNSIYPHSVSRTDYLTADQFGFYGRAYINEHDTIITCFHWEVS